MLRTTGQYPRELKHEACPRFGFRAIGKRIDWMDWTRSFRPLLVLVLCPWSYSVRTARPHTSRAHARRLGQLSGAVLTVAAAIGFGLASSPSCLAQTDPEP